MAYASTVAPAIVAMSAYASSDCCLCLPVEEFITSDLLREIIKLRHDEYTALAGHVPAEAHRVAWRL